MTGSDAIESFQSIWGVFEAVLLCHENRFVPKTSICIRRHPNPFSNHPSFSSALVWVKRGIGMYPLQDKLAIDDCLGVAKSRLEQAVERV